MVGNKNDAVRTHRWTDKQLELKVIHVSLYPFMGGSVEISLLLLSLLSLLLLLLLLLVVVVVVAVVVVVELLKKLIKLLK